MLPNVVRKHFLALLLKQLCSTRTLIGMFQPLNGVLNTSKKHVRRMLTLWQLRMQLSRSIQLDFECALRQPFLAATPDGVVSCSCCGEGLLEIKCPFKYRNSQPASIEDESTKVGSEVTLDKKHDYYYQVQGQMAIWKKPYCDFICWTTKGLIITRIQADGNF